MKIIKLDNFMNIYSLTIVGTLILLFIISYFYALYKDKYDERGIEIVSEKNFIDKYQQILIKFYKEGFHHGSIFFKTYIYLVKSLNPLFSMFYIYNPVYNRTTRTLDFFLSIYLPFFFTLLSFYLKDNTVLVEMQISRKIENKNKNVNDLKIQIKQIIDGLIFSVLASIISTILNSTLHFLFYENVVLYEALERHKKLKFLIFKQFNLIPDYKIKLNSGFIRLKILILISQKFRKKINKKLEVNSKILCSTVISSCRIICNNNENKLFLINDSNKQLIKIPKCPELKKNPNCHKLKKTKNKYLREAVEINSLHSLFEKEIKNNYDNKDNNNDNNDDDNNNGKVLFSIENFEIIFIKERNIDKNGNTIYIFKKRKFPFPFTKKLGLGNELIIECFQIEIINIKKDNHKKYFRMIIKKFLISIIFLFIWIFLMIFINAIYEKYGNNMIEICIYPLISTLIINFFFIFNIKIFFMTLILHFKFHMILNTKKVSIIIGIILQILVPPMAIFQYSAIKLFLMLTKNQENLKRNQKINNIL